MAFGIIDTSYIDWPSNIDAAYLRGLQTRSGLQFTQLAGSLDAAVGRINQIDDPLLRLLMAPPTSNEFSQGGRSGRMVATRKSQYTTARPQQVERTAHMLAIDEFEINMGFTEDGLMEISLDSFNAQLDGLVAGMKAVQRAETLNRLFSAGEAPVAAGTTATSPGLIGSGAGANAFSGVYPDGTAVASNATHYVRAASADLAATIKAQRDKLKKWHQGPFDLFGSDAMITAIAALSGFVSSGSELVRVGGSTSEALVDPGMYVGVFDMDIRVHRPIMDFTSDHFAIVKSYGDLNPLNPLVWRYDPMRGAGAYVRTRELFPLAGASTFHKFGANVNDRTGAAVVKIASSGDYAGPALAY
jgi:hypothetical protein